MTPQLLLTLSPSGTLQIELPTPAGRRLIPVLPGQLEATAIRILQAQIVGDTARTIGQLSDPSSFQVIHWNKHSDIENPVRDPQCPFCRDDNIEDAICLASTNWKEPISSPPAKKKFRLGDGSVTVRRLPPSSRHIRQQHSSVNPDDLGI